MVLLHWSRSIATLPSVRSSEFEPIPECLLLKLRQLQQVSAGLITCPKERITTKKCSDERMYRGRDTGVVSIKPLIAWFLRFSDEGLGDDGSTVALSRRSRLEECLLWCARSRRGQAKRPHLKQVIVAVEFTLATNDRAACRPGFQAECCLATNSCLAGHSSSARQVATR